MNFSAKIIALTKATLDATETQNFIIEGCNDVVSKVKMTTPPKVALFETKSGSISDGTEIDDVYQEITSVEVGGYPCRNISPRLRVKAADSGSIHYATSTDPVFYILNHRLYVLPSASAIYYYIPEYTVTNWNASDGSIDGFPSQYYDHVIHYAAASVCKHEMSEALSGFITAGDAWITDEDIEMLNAQVTNDSTTYNWYKDQYVMLRDSYHGLFNLPSPGSS
tara:strand:+ start:511 stop:1179 length:669 start_codon:yes stop_codon:yes gene_type:complete